MSAAPRPARPDGPALATAFRQPRLRAVAALLGMLGVGWCVPVEAQGITPQPLLRDGPCPGGYYASGNYCMPTSSARPAVPRGGGACPGGYYASGNYCVAASPGARLAIPRQGACPGGFYASGDFCVSTR